MTGSAGAALWAAADLDFLCAFIAEGRNDNTTAHTTATARIRMRTFMVFIG
jgi:hypothetical protein